MKILDTTPGQSATFTATHMSTGGNSSDYRRVAHTYNTGAIIVAHLRNGAVYTPALQGPLTALSYSYDLIHFNPPAGQAVAYWLLVAQNNSYYAGPDDLVFSQSWSCFERTLCATEFSRVAGAGPPVPDFSASGAPMQFGYITGNSSDGGVLHRESGIDNWLVNLPPPLTLMVDKNRLSWTDLGPGVSYDVVRGSLEALRNSHGDFSVSTDGCLADNLTTNSLSDSSTPPPGYDFWFLVRCVTASGASSFDSGYPSQVGSRDVEIAASGNNCP